ncbi:MAG: efflux RND transporter periplasmic adaptor subunit [Tepidisphaeraceae bacterium]
MSKQGSRPWRGMIGLGVACAGFVIGVSLLMLWITGFFGAKVDAHAVGPGAVRLNATAVLATVEARQLPIEETAVGTIQPVHRVELASRLLARIVTLDVVAGQAVKQGDVLVRLEDADLEARVKQAQAQLAQAVAERDRSKLDADRLVAAAANNAASPNERDRAIAAYKAAEAAVSAAEQSEAEARTLLAYSVITSPIDGVVVDKRMNTGDTVSPGQVIVTLLDPKRMQLVASVRESLSQRLKVGGSVTVRVDSVDHACTGTVSEIVPEASGTSRTFQVKVTGPCPTGVYAGMFGRLVIELGQESVLVVPQAAIQRTGQLEFVTVARDGAGQRRLVRLGRSLGSDLEVLSGLRAGEQVAVSAAEASHE